MTNEFKHDEVKQPNKADTGKLLAIDTATAAMSVAVLAGGRVEAEATSMVERNHSVYLNPAIDGILGQAGIRARGLSGIAVGRGPGSYTGVRIGVTVAKTMAWALGIPVVGVSTLEALAAGALAGWMAQPEADGFGCFPSDGGALRKIWVVPLLNARRGQAFTALYELRAENDIRQTLGHRLWPVAEGGWSCRSEDAIALVERWVEQVLELARAAGERPDAVLFAGETAEFGKALERFTAEADWATTMDGKVATGVAEVHVNARYIGYLGAVRLESGLADEAHTLLPNYTQLTEAEVKLNARMSQGQG